MCKLGQKTINTNKQTNMFINVCMIHVLSFVLQRLLTAFIQKLFTSKSFEGDFVLVSNMEGTGKKISMPDGVR